MADLKALTENEEALADALLPNDPDVTKALDQRDRFLTHAYLVLACALIEEFIEGCFREYVDEASASAPAGYAGCFVSLATKFADDLIGQNKGSVPAPEGTPEVLRGLYDSKVISTNNGVRRRNLEALAKPLGLRDRLEGECEDLLGPADALGSKRGAVAHIGTVDEEIRPGEARQLVNDVLGELDRLVTLLGL